MELAQVSKLGDVLTISCHWEGSNPRAFPGGDEGSQLPWLVGWVWNAARPLLWGPHTAPKWEVGLAEKKGEARTEGRKLSRNGVGQVSFLPGSWGSSGKS